MIVPAFSASVISYLTTEKVKIPFTDLNTLTKEGNYKLVAIKLPMILSYFQVSLELRFQRKIVIHNCVVGKPQSSFKNHQRETFTGI